MRKSCIAAILFLSGCGPAGPPPIANAIPADSIAAAVLDLAALRSSPAFAKLPVVSGYARQMPDDVKQMALAWNGRDLLLLATGQFGVSPPQGYTGIGKGIAASGAPEHVEAARIQLTARTAASVGLPQIPAEIQAVVRSDGRLPFTGNLSNLGNLLRMATYTTAVAHVQNAVEVELAAQCRSADEARQLLETLRAMKTLAAAATRDAEIAAMLRDIQTTRENVLVRVRGIARPELIAKALGLQ